MRSQPAVIVLGAGQGRRFGLPTHKLSQALGTESLISRSIRNAVASGLPVVVVTTHRFAEEAARQVARRDVVILGGADGLAPGGLGDSIAAGVSARPGASGWVMLPADMPLVLPSTLRLLAQSLRHHPLVQAHHLGQRGLPVGLAGELFSELVRLSGEDGLRRVLARYPGHALEVDDPGILLDVDTPQDLARARAELDTTTGWLAE